MRSRQFVIVQLSRLLLLILLNVTLLRVFHLGLDGALIGNLAVAVSSGLVTAVVLLRSAGLQPSTEYFKELVTFGLPYIPAVVFSYVIGNADRLALIHFGAVASLGLLALAGKIGEMAVMVFSGPVDYVWSPYALSVYAEADGPKKIGATYTKFVAMYVLMALGASLAAPIGVSLLAKSDYAFAARLVPIVVACLGLQCADDAVRYRNSDLQENMDKAVSRRSGGPDCSCPSVAPDPSIWRDWRGSGNCADVSCRCSW